MKVMGVDGLKAVRIEIEFNDGQIRRLVGDNAARWLEAANELSLAHPDKPLAFAGWQKDHSVDWPHNH